MKKEHNFYCRIAPFSRVAHTGVLQHRQELNKILFKLIQVFNQTFVSIYRYFKYQLIN
jgi:hypothetical protein